MYNICVLPGDGIGKDVIPEAVRVLKATGLNFEFVYGDIGFEAYQKLGSSLPDATIEKVKAADSCLFGAVTTPPNIPNYSSPILKMRKALDLYINLRPNKSYPLPQFRQGVDIVMFRENTEGMYSGRERLEDNGNTAITERVITRRGSERIIKAAFEYALANGRKKVTCVHKANVLRETCGLFLRVFQEIAKEYPTILAEDMIVDATAMQLIKKPEAFDVIVTTNLFGDILSDEACMLVGGLGLAASGNIGDRYAVFEPVHGSAPKYAGGNVANPIASISAAKMMLDHLGEKEAAMRVENAILTTMRQGVLPQDLGGKATMSDVTDAVIKNLG